MWFPRACVAKFLPDSDDKEPDAGHDSLKEVHPEAEERERSKVIWQERERDRHKQCESGQCE